MPFERSEKQCVVSHVIYFVFIRQSLAKQCFARLLAFYTEGSYFTLFHPSLNTAVLILTQSCRIRCDRQCLSETQDF